MLRFIHRHIEYIGILALVVILISVLISPAASELFLGTSNTWYWNLIR